MRAVIDTNVLLQALPKTGKFAALLDAFADGAFSWVLSTDIQLEYLEMLDRKGSATSRFLWEGTTINLPGFITASVYYRFNIIITDPDDNKFVDAYIASDADYLVTEDGHFDVLKELGFPKVNVVTPQEFIPMLQPKSL